MSFPHRIRTIYGKELVDILRDHRTLTAMIVVPIVLYPLLMLGAIQAVSYQSERIAEEQIVIGVVNEEQGQSLFRLINSDANVLERERSREDARGAIESAAGNVADTSNPIGDTNGAGAPTSIDPAKVKIVNLESAEKIEAAIRERRIHLGVVFDRDRLIDAPDVTNQIRFLIDKEDVRSIAVRHRLGDVIQRTVERTRAERKATAGLPLAFDQPFALEIVDLSAPPSILGQILPLILVLMTITGAIYPAIDLTAGERERGTLESLMVCPVPVIDLIVGKFLVVTTVAIIGAALNLTSVTCTVYFGGFNRMIASSGGGLPIAKMAFILLCLIPFAVLMSAIMLAVCSFARTFKEAQNYVTPVILGVLIPGGIAAMPGTRLEGVMLAMPVGNMVLLARDFLLGAVVSPLAILMVLASTTLYAAASVAVAANVFGQESVVFSDAGSWKAMFTRRFIKPTHIPSISMSLLFVAVLFPLWFFIQSALAPTGPGENAVRLLMATAWLMPLLFVIVPLGVLIYWKVDVREALALRVPSARHIFAAVLIGLTAWIPSREITVLQFHLVDTPQGLTQSAESLSETLRALPALAAFLIVAVIPAVSEELLFRGFLFSGLRGAGRVRTAILASAAVFAVFHFIIFKFAVTFVLGAILAYLCWRSRSIVPGIIAHALNNGLGVMDVLHPSWREWIGLPLETVGADEVSAHLPIPILIVGTMFFLLGIRIARGKGHRSPSIRD